MAQNIEYAVQMHRPDRVRVVNRKFYEDKPIEAASDRQLLGFLTHKLFSDKERGKEGTVYVLKIRVGNLIDVRTFTRTVDGRYERI